MKIYNSFEEIDNELKRLELQRAINLEELKMIKHDFKEDLQPFQWLQTGAKYAGKFGMMVLIKKLFRK
jgi:hypothetical protein